MQALDKKNRLAGAIDISSMSRIWVRLKGQIPLSLLPHELYARANCRVKIEFEATEKRLRFLKAEPLKNLSNYLNRDKI